MMTKVLVDSNTNTISVHTSGSRYQSENIPDLQYRNTLKLCIQPMFNNLDNAVLRTVVQTEAPKAVVRMNDIDLHLSKNARWHSSGDRTLLPHSGPLVTPSVNVSDDYRSMVRVNYMDENSDLSSQCQFECESIKGPHWQKHQANSPAVHSNSVARNLGEFSYQESSVPFQNETPLLQHQTSLLQHQTPLTEAHVEPFNVQQEETFTEIHEELFKQVYKEMTR